MKKIFLSSLIILGITALIISCKKDTKTTDPEPEPEPVSNCPAASCVNPDTIFNVPTSGGPFVIFKFKFDSTQARLNNFGLTSTIPSTNAAFSPIFNKMSAHYIEMAPIDATPVGGGKVLYRAAETKCDNNENAITFCQSVVVRENVIFFAVPISSITPGSYKWLRVSLAYQNYDIAYKASSCTPTQWGTVASFVGFNTYVSQYKIKNNTMVPTESLTSVPNGTSGGNVKQGYWGFESLICGSLLYKVDGKAAGTTVVNPNFLNSPIPSGSCLVTGEFNKLGVNTPIVITGLETSDIIVTVSLSTNKSFEWKENTFDGYYQPEAGEFPVDMGIRGMIAKY